MKSDGTSRRVPGVTIERLLAQAAEGSKETWYSTARMMVKYDAETTSMAVVANEFICSRLATALGVPVPVGDAAQYRDRKAWASAQIDLDGTTLPPSSPKDVAHEAPGDLAAIFVFDVWIHNEDRHEENVLFHPRTGAWAIDHEQALGAETSLDPARLKTQTSRATSWHYLDAATLDKDQVDAWVGRVQTFPKGSIRAILREAQNRRLVTDKEGTALTTFLSARADSIVTLVRRSQQPRNRSGGETDWTTTETSLFGGSSSISTTSIDTNPETSE